MGKRIAVLGSFLLLLSGLNAHSLTTIGSPLQDRVNNDGSAGQVYLYNQVGGITGTAETFQFYDNEAGSRTLTPLIFEKTASTQFILRGVGTPRTTTGAGIQTYPFGLLAGTSVMGPNFCFGFTDRTLSYPGSGNNLTTTASSAGSVDWDYTAPTSWYFTPSLSFDIALAREFNVGGVTSGNSVGLYSSETRTYSAQLVIRPADYTISTTGNAIIVTDVSGNSDTLTVSSPGAGLIKFAAAGRYFSINGGPNVSGDSGNQAVAGVTSISINAGLGDDTINVSSLPASYTGSLIIDGGLNTDTINLSPGLPALAGLRIVGENLGVLPALSIGTGGLSIAITTSAITQNGALTVSGTSSFNAGGNAITLTAAGNSFTGTITIANGGGNPVGLTSANTLTLGSANFGSGAVTITAPDLILAGGANSIAGTGALSLRPVATSSTIGIGAGATGSFNLNAADLAALADGFSSITIGISGTGTGAMDIRTCLFKDNLFLYGGSATVAQLSAGTNDITLTTNPGAIVHSTGATGSDITGKTVTLTKLGATHSNFYGIGDGDNGLTVDATTLTTSSANGSTRVVATGTGGMALNLSQPIGVGAGNMFVSSSTENLTISSVTANSPTPEFLQVTINGYNLVANNVNVSGFLSFTTTNSGNITLGSTVNSGTLAVTAAGSLTVNGPINSADTATFTADSMSVAGTITVPANKTVALRPRTVGQLINLGAADSPGTLGLTDAELDLITAGTLTIGDANSGAMTQSAAMSRPAATAVNLNSGSSITIATGPFLTAGGNLTVTPGSGSSFRPTASGTDVSVGTFNFGSGSRLGISFTSATVYDTLTVSGAVNLTGVTLQLTDASGGTYVPSGSATFTLIENDGTDAVTGTFLGLAEGAIVSVNGVTKKITYVGGTGNDVVLLSGGLPKIGVWGNGAAITNGSPTPGVLNGTDFGSVSVNGGAVVRTFTVTNSGAAALSLTGSPKVAVSGAQAADFVVTAQPASPVAPGNSTTFQVKFDPSAVGLRTATLSLASDDSTNGIYTFVLQGTGVVPALAVEQPVGTKLTAGAASVGFGTVFVGGSRTFTLRNTGLGVLNLTNILTTGGNAASFAVGGLALPANLGPGASTNFTVNFVPLDLTTQNTTLQIVSDDPTSNPFDISLSGSGTNVVYATYSNGNEIPATVSSFPATGKSVVFTLNYAPVPGTVLMVVKNTGLPFTVGTLNNLAQGQLVFLTYGGVLYPFVADYYGGNGNDLVLRWASNRLVAWGYGSSGQLGNGAVLDNLVPVSVVSTGVLSGKTIIGAAKGFAHSVALCSDGTVATWGGGSSGQLGAGPGVTGSSLPVAVNQSGVLAGKRVISVAAGGYYTLALCSDGTIASWGTSGYGQLGNGSLTGTNVPVLVATNGALAGKTVVQIAAGDYEALALCSDGTLVQWGFRYFDDNNNLVSSTDATPTLVTTNGSAIAGKTVVAISSGGSPNLALCSDGSLAAWGANAYGEITGFSGQGKPYPIVLGALTNRTITQISAGGAECSVVCSDGSVVTWGLYSGDGVDNNSRRTPVLVDTSPASALFGKTAVTTAAGYNKKEVLCSDGTIVAWGYGDYGNLGDGAGVDRLIPVAVLNTPLTAGERYADLFHGGGSFHGLALVGSPPSPGIVVELPSGNTLTDGGSTADFGVTLTGASTTRTFTIRNTGLGVLLVTNLTITGANAADFAVGGLTLPATIAQQSSATCTVSFAPGAVGSRSAALQILNNDGVVGPFDITLTGTGTNTLYANYTTGTEIPVTTPVFTATGRSVVLTLNYAPTPGTVLTIVKNTGLPFIAGAFSNLAQGQKVTLTYGGLGYDFVADYYGGNGNDLVLRWANNRLVSWGYGTTGLLGNGAAQNSLVPVSVVRTGVLAGKTITGASKGFYHSIALCSDGTVATWGSDAIVTTGPFGLGRAASSVPVAVNPLGVLAGKRVVAVAAGINHNLALCSDGTIAAWGDGGYGQLGNGSLAYNNVPGLVDTNGVLAGKTVVQIAAGDHDALALCSDGTLVQWGYRDVDDNDNLVATTNATPILVTTTGSAIEGKTVVTIAAGGQSGGGSACHLAICSDGSLAAWGVNNYGQLTGSSPRGKPYPVVLGALTNRTITQISAAGGECSVLCSDGSVVTWGIFSGDGVDNNARRTPVLVDTSPASALYGRTAVTSAAGVNTKEVLCTDGTIVAWGFNGYGCLGDGTSITRTLPVATLTTPLAAGERYVDLYQGGGALHGLALVATPGAVLNATYASANDVPLTTSTFTGLGYTVNFTLNYVPAPGTTLTVIKNTGSNYLQGVFDNLPNGRTVSLPYNGTNYPFVAWYYGGTAGQDLVLLWPSVGMAAWGDNSAGQLGDNSVNNRRVPVSADPTGVLAGKTIVQLARGSLHTLALTTEGRVYAWGRNNEGQLGNGTLTNSSVPQAVTVASGALAGKTVIAVAAGHKQSYALCSDGTIAAWGWNGHAQLGNNSYVDSSIPVAVNAVNGVSALFGKTPMSLSAGEGHCLALCSDGTLVAWGYGGYGQLGDATGVDRPVPVLVNRANGISALFGKTVIAVSAGYFHSLALCSDGTIATWGFDQNGRLGTGSLASHFATAPVAVSADSGLSALFGRTPVAVAAAIDHSLALCSDGTIVGWGDNSAGSLGNNTTTNSAYPVAANTAIGLSALSGKTVVSIHVAGGTSIALCSDGTITEWGLNDAGQLGDNTLTNHLVPLAVNTTPGTSALAGRSVLGIAGSGHNNEFVLATYALSNSPAIFTHAAVDNWAVINGLHGADAGPLADSDGDGIPNFAEFAFALDPKANDTLSTPASFDPSLHTMTVVYTRSKAAVAAGLIFTVQWSATAGGPWQSTGVSNSITDLGTTERVTATVSAPGAALFTRVQVTEP